MFKVDKECFVAPRRSAPLGEVGQCLMRAAQIIRENGWHHGGFTGPHGERCMVAALLDASPTKIYQGSIAHKAHEKLLARGYGMAWNDLPGRTAAEVIAALEEVAQATNGSGS